MIIKSEPFLGIEKSEWDIMAANLIPKLDNEFNSMSSE